MKEPWKNDPNWKSLPLSDRLEDLRKYYCTGIFGARVDFAREALDNTLREARLYFIRNEIKEEFHASR